MDSTKRKQEQSGPLDPPAKRAAVEPWNCFTCVDKRVTGARCPSCHGEQEASDERRGEEENPDCYWNGCDLGCCEGCGMHTTSTCQREECGGDGCMEYEGCCCDCEECNSVYGDCYCSRDEKKLLPQGTLEHLAKFQAVVRGASQRECYIIAVPAPEAPTSSGPE
jgi:hypothetical protein